MNKRIVKLLVFILSIVVAISPYALYRLLRYDSQDSEIAGVYDDHTSGYQEVFSNKYFKILEMKLGEDLDPLKVEDRLSCHDIKDFDCNLQQTGKTVNNLQQLECKIEKGDDTFKLISFSGGEKYELWKNDKLIWEQNLGVSPSIAEVYYFRNINDSIILAFHSISNDYKSILVDGYDIQAKKSDTSILVAPNKLNGGLSYFAKNSDGTWFINFNESKYELPYDTIHTEDNRYTCISYEGEPTGIIGNDRRIEFFAKKGDNWYHVKVLGSS